MIDTINDIQKNISQTLPAARSILEDMNSVTNDILSDTSLRIDIPNIDTPLNSDALDIFNEIKDRITEETKSRLPLPPVINELLHDKNDDFVKEMTDKEILIET